MGKELVFIRGHSLLYDRDRDHLRGRLSIRKDFVGHDGTPLRKDSRDVGHTSNSFLIELLTIHMDIRYHWS